MANTDGYGSLVRQVEHCQKHHRGMEDARHRVEQAEQEAATLRLQIARLQGQLAYIRDAIMAEDIPQLSRYGWLRRWAEGDAPARACPDCATLRGQVEQYRDALIDITRAEPGKGNDDLNAVGTCAQCCQMLSVAEAALSAIPAPAPCPGCAVLRVQVEQAKREIVRLRARLDEGKRANDIAHGRIKILETENKALRQQVEQMTEIVEAANDLDAYEDFGDEEPCQECLPPEPGAYLAARQRLYQALDAWRWPEESATPAPAAPVPAAPGVVQLLPTITCAECSGVGKLYSATVTIQREDGTWVEVQGFPAWRCSKCGAEWGDAKTSADLFAYLSPIIDAADGGAWCVVCRIIATASCSTATTPAPAATAQWQPFFTAPTDGTEIIVYRPDAGVFTAHYHPSLDEDGEWDEENCFWFTVQGGDLTGDLPTHWMPLPSPPPPRQTPTPHNPPPIPAQGMPQNKGGIP